MLAPLSKGTHTIHLTGLIHFSVAEGDPFDGDSALDLSRNQASSTSFTDISAVGLGTSFYRVRVE
jgi:hypothetical protein